MQNQSSPQFQQILSELGELHLLKSSEYGTEEDPFANLRDSLTWTEDPWLSAVSKLISNATDSIKAAHGADTRRRAVVTALNDVASYAIIARILYEEQYQPPSVEHEWVGQPAQAAQAAQAEPTST